MKIDNKYGYKLGYKEFDFDKLKTQMITRSFDLIIWEIQWYKYHPFYDRLDHHLIKNPIWHIHDIKTLNEYNKLWKGCPFKDDLS